MKLRNKETGEIGNLITICAQTRVFVKRKSDKVYNSLAELNEEWEDYEEPEEFWYINECGDVLKYKYDGGCSCPILEAEEIGNYFETKEEAEKAVEKLKAWKRLKDKGFRFRGLGVDNYEIDDIKYEMKEPPITHDCQEMKDLKLLFGGKE